MRKATEEAAQIFNDIRLLDKNSEAYLSGLARVTALLEEEIWREMLKELPKDETQK